MSSQTSASIESAKLATMGETFLDMIIILTTSTLFYGIFVLLYSQSTATFLQKGLSGRNQILMFSASTFTFILSTVLIGTLIAQIGIFVHTVFFGYQGVPVAAKLPLVSGPLLPLEFAGTWGSTITVIISDGIVTWRAFVLLQHRQRLIILPLLLLLASIVMYLGFLISTTVASEPLGTHNVFAAAIALSLGNNITSTFLIGYVYWLQRKDMIACFHGRQRRTQGEWVLAILVESGIIFCLFQTLYFMLEFIIIDSLSGAYAVKIFRTVYFGFAMIYPTLVIVMVNSRRTFDQAYFTEISLSPSTLSRDMNSSATLQRMSFATPASESIEIFEGRKKKSEAPSDLESE